MTKCVGLGMKEEKKGEKVLLQNGRFLFRDKKNKLLQLR